MSVPYDFKAIEPKWQQQWEQWQLFRAPDHSDKKKFYCLMMFPYPSGTLHVGHGRNYIIGDVVTRYYLMKGYNVMNPMGWDAFGLPAENYAIKVGRHPKDTTAENIAKMKEQFRSWGVGYDWDREVTSCKPNYYKWTQWLFLQFYKKGLAYRRRAPVNWCPGCKTVLANEQVTPEGRCERSGDKVEQRDMEQWFFKITEYAQRLLDDLDKIEWPAAVIKQQQQWIGRSEGCYIDFTLVGGCDQAPEQKEFPVHGVRRADQEVLLRVFTTRPDTVYGVTFMAMAPEHPMLPALLDHPDCTLDQAQKAQVREFIQECRATSTYEREAESAPKKGLFIGRMVKNPLLPDGEPIPVFVGNYVLMYGTGIVMAVPAHDQRDFEFAREHDLRIVKVVQPPEKCDPQWLAQYYGGPNDDPQELAKQGIPEDIAQWRAAFTGPGTSVNSGEHSGLPTAQMQQAVAQSLSQMERGGQTVAYRLRDWLLSRQRYWGCPIPMVYCDQCGLVPVPEKDLPVELPIDVDFKDRQGNPLAASESFVKTTCPQCQGPARRETDTMDTFVCSSWYFLRYISPHDDQRIFDSDLVNAWLPVDQYIGGIEHATGHLIYSRFFTKVLYDLGLINFEEPFAKLFTQGMIVKNAFICETHNFLSPQEVKGVDEQGHFTDAAALRCAHCDKPVTVQLEKMSKSKFNVVDPAYLIEKYGVDTQRLYTLFIGPPIKDAEWQDEAVIGSWRFLGRFWDQSQAGLALVRDESVTETATGLSEQGRALRRKTHQTIKKVTENFEHGFQFNTAIAAVMELSNHIRAHTKELHQGGAADRWALKEALISSVLLLAPMTPHIAEELWQQFGHQESIFRHPWPVCQEQWLAVDEIELAVQINGKRKARITVPAQADKSTVEAAARERVAEHLSGKKVKKVIVVPGKLVNIVVG